MGNLRNNGEWTEGRYRSFITSTLRGGMRRWPPKWKTLKSAEVGRITNKKTGKLAMHYICAGCNSHYPAKDVQVDHMSPVVDPTTGFVSWDVYIDRMFCETSNLQVLCTTCHKDKTAKEKNDSKRLPNMGSGDSPTNSPTKRLSKPRASGRSGGGSKPIRKSRKG